MARGFLLFIASVVLQAGFAAVAADRFSVYAVNYPLAYFAERIGGEYVDVTLPVPAGIDPAFWEPGVEDILGFQQADLILLNGAGYAKWLKRASLPRRKQVNTSAAFSDNYIKVKETVTHRHGPGGEHSHAGTAFTTWLDFSQAVEQARAIKLALQRKLPEQAESFEQKFGLLEQELQRLDQAMMAMAAKRPDMQFLASHPVYQYLARRYQIRLESLMWEPEVIPDEAQLRLLTSKLDTHQAEWMIWEGEPAPQTVARLKPLGFGSLVFDPCGDTPDEGDFIAVMKRNIKQLEEAFQP